MPCERFLPNLLPTRVGPFTVSLVAGTEPVRRKETQMTQDWCTSCDRFHGDHDDDHNRQSQVEDR